MAAYSFENITAEQAASFGTNDYLFFTTNGASASQVTVMPYQASSGVLSGSGITLTFAGISHTFNNSISSASMMNHIQFNDNSHLVIGTVGDGSMNAMTNGNDTYNYTGANNSQATDPYTVYTLSGNDTINFGGTTTNGVTTGGSAPMQSLYLNGGFGSDTIIGGAGNAHIYGNSMGSGQGATQNGTIDGGDSIVAGGGTNYINGNGGADTITAGVAGSTGYDRVFGGSENDIINILGNGHNQVNGNTGNDIITDSGFGDNTLRGGQGNDSIVGGSGHSILMGDAGNDTIVVHGRAGENITTGTGTNAVTSGQHLDVISGGGAGAGGNDSNTFDFSAAGAGQVVKIGQAVYYQEITDFTHGSDRIYLTAATTNGTANTSAVVLGTSATTFATVHDAEVYAQAQLNATGTANSPTPNVEALMVGSGSTASCYVFYTDMGNMSPAGTNEVANLGVIHLDNVQASTLTTTDFFHA